MAGSLVLLSILESNSKSPEVCFMYRPPGREKHQKLTDVLDEVIIRLEKIEKLLETLNSES